MTLLSCFVAVISAFGREGGRGGGAKWVWRREEMFLIPATINLALSVKQGPLLLPALDFTGTSSKRGRKIPERDIRNRNLPADHQSLWRARAACASRNTRMHGHWGRILRGRRAGGFVYSFLKFSSSSSGSCGHAYGLLPRLVVLVYGEWAGGRPPLADSRSNQLEVGKLLQLSPSSKTNRGHLKNKEAVVDVGAAEVWSGAAAKAITNAREVQ